MNLESQKKLLRFKRHKNNKVKWLKIKHGKIKFQN